MKYEISIVGKGVISPLSRSAPPPPLFSKISPFLEIHNVPAFHRFIRETIILNNLCNQFEYHFYPQSILILEKCLQKWNENLI